MDVREAVTFWIDEIEERAATREADGLPPEQIDADTIEALRSIGDSATAGQT